MADIRVDASQTDKGWMLRVTVDEGSSRSEHTVGLKRADFERLAGGQGTPEDLVKESFEFLLEREPKESILSRFDLPLIGRYFPEYEGEIRRRIGGGR